MSKHIRRAVLVLLAVLVFGAGTAYAAEVPQDTSRAQDNEAALFQDPAEPDGLSRQASGGKVRVSAAQPGKYPDQFAVVVTDVDRKLDARDLEIRVWPLSHQSETVSYPAKKKGAAFTAIVDISRHKNRVGTYVVAVFTAGEDGEKAFAGGATTYVPPVPGSLTAKAGDDSQSEFSLSLSGAILPEESHVIFQIRETGGDRPFLLNRAARKNGKVFTYTVPAKNLVGPGTYTVEALCTSPSMKEFAKIGAAAFVVDGIKAGSAHIRASEEDNGAFHISAFAQADQVITSMEADVWTKADKSDLMTLQMARDGEGWAADGNTADHSGASGTYYVKTYATLANGVVAEAAEAEAFIETGNCIWVEQDEKGATVHLEKVPSHVGRVQIATWSVQNGQNDMVWYDAVKTEEGTWEGRVEYRRHRHSGTFRTDVFTDGQLVSTISYEVPAEQLPETEEMRGVWVPAVYNLDFPRKMNDAEAQKEEFRRIVRNAKAWGMNTLFIQVRPHADAMYASEFQPWSSVLTGTWGKDPGYDPLAFAIETAHAEGIELHAWLNPYRVCFENEISKLSPMSAAVQHPDWVLKHKGWVWLDPGNPGVQQHLVDTVREIIENYDVDGIHMDDFFYPYDYPLPAGERRNGAVGNQYRENVTAMIRMVAQVVHKAPGNLMFGISPFGIWKNRDSDPAGSATSGLESYYSNYSDSLGWVKEGLLDYVAPQLYWNRGHSGADYTTLVDWWSHAVEGTGTDLVIGHGVYKEEVAAEIDAQLEINSQYGNISGSIFYRYGDLEKHPEVVQRIMNWYDGRDARQTETAAS